MSVPDIARSLLGAGVGRNTGLHGAKIQIPGDRGTECQHVQKVLGQGPFLPDAPREMTWVWVGHMRGAVCFPSNTVAASGAADRRGKKALVLPEQSKQALCAVHVSIDSSNDLPQLPAFVYWVKINATDVHCIIGFEICCGEQPLKPLGQE